MKSMKMAKIARRSTLNPQEIVRRRDNGETLAQLAARFRTTKGTVSRIVALERLKQIQEFDLSHIPNERFDRMGAVEERQVLGPAPENRQAGRKVQRAQRIAVVLGEHV